MELGIYTFAEMSPDPATGKPRYGAGERLRNLMEEIELADQLGLDVFGVGEHHRPDFAVSAPAVVLAAAAMRTKRIKLTSAVTVLSSDDPVRVYQEFSTVDLLSGGRAEIMAGRGSFIESFPLFGFDLGDYDELFAEKLQLLMEIRENAKVTWEGRHRPSLKEQGVYPRDEREIPLWIAVGGTPQSVVRAGMLGLPLAVAIIGGQPAQFGPLVNLYRQALERGGHDPTRIPVGINSHGYVADTPERAAEEAFPPFAEAMSRIGRERGWPPTTRADFDASRRLEGATFIGSPEQVVEKILWQHEIFKHQRFLIQFSVGSIPHAQLMHSIELFGTKVAPAVRKALGGN
ncbi:MAG: LLM class flavin-dependent oxidoreductase [Rhizobiales bacterium]|nr:LLM class flavin-dependent oxidoreductase [Hyphomicrobiales bacterium]